MRFRPIEEMKKYLKVEYYYWIGYNCLDSYFKGHNNLAK